MADLSPDGANAIVVGGLQTSQSPPAAIGVAYRSTDGGRSYTRITGATGLPSTPRFFGTGFINNTDAFLLGDTSTVLRVNTTTGAVTVLDVTNGIPQSSFDPATGTRLSMCYRRARFAPDDPNVGWIIGFVVRRVPGQADVRRGILLITSDGGRHSLVRQ